MPAPADEISAYLPNSDEVFGQLPNEIEKFGDLPKSCLGKSRQVPCPEIGKKMRFSEEKWLFKPRGFAERDYRTALLPGDGAPAMSISFPTNLRQLDEFLGVMTIAGKLGSTSVKLCR